MFRCSIELHQVHQCVGRGSPRPELKAGLTPKWASFPRRILDPLQHAHAMLAPGGEAGGDPRSWLAVGDTCPALACLGLVVLALFQSPGTSATVHALSVISHLGVRDKRRAQARHLEEFPCSIYLRPRAWRGGRLQRGSTGSIYRGFPNGVNYLPGRGQRAYSP